MHWYTVLLLQEVNNDLLEVAERQNAMFKSFENLNVKLNELTFGMKSLTNYTRNTLLKHTEFINTLWLKSVFMPMLMEEKFGLVVYPLDLLRRTLAFQNGIQELLRGKLSMELVPPYSITKAVIRAQQYLTQTYPRFRVAFTEPSFYYDNAKPMFVRDGMDFIIIYIRIPVVSEEHLFRVYQVLSFPVPVRLQNTHDTDA